MVENNAFFALLPLTVPKKYRGKADIKEKVNERFQGV
jgi:hypothetical protein